jgi:hypothetical protein
VLSLPPLKPTSQGRGAQCRELLSDSPLSVEPGGAVYVRYRLLVAGVVLLAPTSLLMTFRPFDNLTPGPYQSLFILALFRAVFFFAMAVECLAWYHSALSELKRTCSSPAATISGA